MQCKLSHSLVSLFLMFAVTIGPGSQAAEKGNATQKPPEQTQSADKSDEKEESNAGSTTFTPTEEISEDLSVSFPVDI